MKATKKFDAVGAETALTYADAGGTEIAAFSNTLDAQSRVRAAESTGSKQTYTYDGRDRLTTVQDTTGGNCVTRQYGFSLDSNRTSLATSSPGTGGECTTSGAATATSAFDAADRITASGYTYDALGRTRSLPATHTDQPAGNALTVDYHGNDMVAKLAQTVPNGTGGTIAKSKVLTLDPSDRVSKITDTAADAEIRKTTNHYASGGDSPAWTETETPPDTATAWSTSWTRNVIGPDGDLAIIQPSSGGPKLQIANLHGDIVATIHNGAFTGFDTWDEANEYGLAESAATTQGKNYRWLGGKLRSTDTIGGLTLMGARLYNPTTGRFLSRDPMPGGNDNTYTYPVDPINTYDLDGLRRSQEYSKWSKKKKKTVNIDGLEGIDKSKYLKGRPKLQKLVKGVAKGIKHFGPNTTTRLKTKTKTRYIYDGQTGKKIGKQTIISYNAAVKTELCAVLCLSLTGGVWQNVGSGYVSSTKWY